MKVPYAGKKVRIQQPGERYSFAGYLVAGPTPEALVAFDDAVPTYHMLGDSEQWPGSAPVHLPVRKGDVVEVLS